MLEINPLVGLWGSGLLFALSHSLLATNRLKAAVYQYGISVKVFRLIYVVISIVSTLIWVLYLHGLDDRTLYSVEAPWRWVSYAIQGFSMGLFYLSLQPIDVAIFLGLKKFPEGKDPFIETGVYKYFRHPMYAAVMLLLFASPDQSVNSLNLYALISIYFVVGSKFEERRLLNVHPEYAEYQKRVAAFIPHFRR